MQRGKGFSCTEMTVTPSITFLNNPNSGTAVHISYYNARFKRYFTWIMET
jgi:hypothetical protein